VFSPGGESWVRLAPRVAVGHDVLVKTGALQGERLVLEPLRPEHADQLRALRRTAEVARWWDPAPEGWPLAADPDLEKFAVTVEGEVAGFIQLWEEPDPSLRHADIDIFLGPAFQDRGFGSEAVQVLVRHLIEERGHHRITLTTSTANERAIRVYEKVGFRRVGVLSKSQRNHATGEWEDELLMEFVV
jgi:aminoglycoside 6'-N-acetyltransferase